MNCICRADCSIGPGFNLAGSVSYGVNLSPKMLAICLMLAWVGNVSAMPVGGVVSAGAANIGGSPGGMIITQSTQSAAINWQSFNIGQSEAVQFVQPNSNSVALNRVSGSDLSIILGSMSANGKVFLVNPNGILFGKGAQVNVGGLVASALNITDPDFMAGNYHFTGANRGLILNQGQINADGGYVALLGANISNEGVILARLGTVVLAAGTSITLDVAGDGLLGVVVDQGVVNGLVQNAGLIQADGGQVLLTALAAGTILQSAVNNTGVVRAQTIENHNGTIRLLGDKQNGSVYVDGTLDASAPWGGNGGFIETSAAHVAAADTAIVSTRSAQGITGGWLIDPTDFTIAATGGDMSGAALGNRLLVSNITISSNDGLSGNSGNIMVSAPVHWASATTLTLNAVHDVLVNAALTADTAGADIVLVAGHDIATTATITVVAATSAITLSAGNDVRIGGIITGTAANSAIGISAVHDVVTTAIINVVAADSSITLKAGNDMRAGGSITAVAAGSSINLQAGRDVVTTITAPILAVAAATLIDLNAGRDVNVNSAISAGAAGSTISMEAGNNVNVISAIAAGAAGSSVLMTAGQNVNVTGALSAGASIVMDAGLNGAGPGVGGGTVNIVGAVTALNTSLRFNPNGYANTSAEIAAYRANATGAMDAKAWVYAGGNNKSYDGTRTASLSFIGNPADGGVINLLPGTATFASKNVAGGNVVNFSGYSIGGADIGMFALFAGSGTTAAGITPALLKVTPDYASKTYGQTPVLTAFSAAGLMAGETIGSITETSTGTAASAGVAGGPYVIVPANAAGGTFLASNYTLNYANGELKVIPANLTLTASDATKVYGQTQTLTAFSTRGLLNGESIGSVIESSPGLTPTAGVSGGPYAITPGSASGGTFTASNYTINYVGGTLSVVPADLLVTVANVSKYYGETALLTAFTIAGLANGETVGAFAETSLGSAASASVAGSPYLIMPGKAAGGTFTASNYAIVYVNGTLTVLPKIQAGYGAMAAAEPNVALSAEHDSMPVLILFEEPPELLSVMPASLMRDANPDESTTLVAPGN